jgi:ligand-binding sensor domain-containing protein
MAKLTAKQRLRHRRAVLVAIGGGLLMTAAVVVYFVRMNRRLDLERQRLAAAARVDVEARELRAPVSEGLTVMLCASDVRAVASFRDVEYLATSGGLIALDEAGGIRKRYTTLDGLPENDLTSLAVFQDRLYAGTTSSGLLAFDGNVFTAYRFNKPKATHVSVLASTETELLIGTLDGGLFEYDGQRFSRRLGSAPGADFSRVTALLPFESRFYIGTQDAGLYIWREAHIEHVTTSEGLPSPHVTAVAPLPPGLSENGVVAVATDFGVVALNDANEMKPISSRPNITSLAVSGKTLWAGLFGGGLVNLFAAERRIAAGEPMPSLTEAVGLPSSAAVKVFALDGRLWALTPVGAFARDERGTRPAFEAVAAGLAGDRALTGGHITGLALDRASRLWVGYFDRGIDLLAPETSERLSHIQDDRVREINNLAFDSAEDRMLASTSRGLVTFSSNLKQEVMTREQGLVSDSVAQVLLTGDDSLSGASGGRVRTMVLATAGGLTVISGGRARSLTAFHGLASNHLYTSASVGSRLFVGSLGGLVELEGLRVVRTYKTSNSSLSHDWVTALAEAGGTLYAGTNGGGVDALLPTGEWINFADEIGKFEVNQNAMHYDGERLYVGTGDRGLLVYNTRGRRWTRVSAGLAAQSVTAITSDERFVFVGTMNGLVRIEKRIIE